MARLFLFFVLSFNGYSMPAWSETVKTLKPGQAYQKALQLAGGRVCSEDKQCQSIGLGAKACGGPWRYIVYSTKDASFEELKAFVDSYNRREKAQPRPQGLVSTCTIEEPPVLHCQQGRCRVR